MQIRFMHGVLGSGKTVFGSSVLVHVAALLQDGIVRSDAVQMRIVLMLPEYARVMCFAWTVA